MIDLLKRIKIGEDSTLELKSLQFQGNKVSEPHTKSMADELSAMANSFAGVFVLGVDDKTRAITGIPIEKLDIAEAWIRDICTGIIEPQLYCGIQKLAIEDENGEEKFVIIIDIPKSLFVHQSPNGYFERIGSQKRKMSPERLARLFQQRSQTRIIYFDAQAVTNATIDCLDRDLCDRFKTKYSSPDEITFLLKAKLITSDFYEKLYPTVTGILMACKNPEEFLPTAYIQAVSYRRKDRDAADQIDTEDITGPLDQQITEACLFVKRNMKVYATKRPARVDFPQYSMRAIFEAIVNAVAHRDYSINGARIRLHLFEDRLELFSPGSIPNTMEIDTLSLRHISRNELLANYLSKLNVKSEKIQADRIYYMERRGEGVPIILSESEKISGKLPVYTLLNDAELLLTIYPAPEPQRN